MNEGDRIDMKEYGALLQDVSHIKGQVIKLEGSVEKILEIINRGRGGLWVGISVISTITAIIGSTIVGLILKHFAR